MVLQKDVLKPYARESDNNMKKRILILGAGGCFGQNLATHLTTRGHDVLGIGRSLRKAPIFSLNSSFPYLKRHLVEDFAQTWHRDVLEFDPEVIVNFAAHAGLVPQSWTYPVEYFETNTMLPVKIAQRLGDSHFIHIGSSEVYGSTNKPVTEDAPIRCSSPYAASKAAADLHLLTLGKRIAVVRPSNCYCPGQALHRLIPRAVLAGLTGQRMKIQGSPRKSYLHAQDLSDAIELIIDRGSVGLYNIGPEMALDIRYVVGEVARQMGSSIERIAEMVPGREHEDACYWIDSSKIRGLGWAPKVEFQDGIAGMIAWGRQYSDAMRTLPIDYRFMP